MSRSRRRSKERAPSPPPGGGESQQGKRGRTAATITVFLVAGSALAGALALSQRHNDSTPVETGPPAVTEQPPPSDVNPPPFVISPEDHLMSWKTAFGQFPPYTEAERELEKLLRGEDKDIDLALANWLVAADVPQFSNMTREEYFKRLDEMADQVRRAMRTMEITGSHGFNISNPDTRCYMFCSAIVGLGFDYREEFGKNELTNAELGALHGDANNTFLAGLLRTRRGTCVSMPLLYLVIGRRLGMPVHLVAIGKHYFIRWEELGYRMNVETTIVVKVCMTPDEDVYLDAEGMTHDDVRGYELRNLTAREVVGNLFFERVAYWGTKGRQCSNQACLDISRAHFLAPEDPAITKRYTSMFEHYGIRPEHTSIDIRPSE